MPLELNLQELRSELETVGLTPELFETILSASPSRQIVVGYPQQDVNAIFVERNW